MPINRLPTNYEQKQEEQNDAPVAEIMIEQTAQPLDVKLVQVVQPTGAYYLRSYDIDPGVDQRVRFDIRASYVTIYAITQDGALSFGGAHSQDYLTIPAGAMRRVRMLAREFTLRNTGSTTARFEVVAHDDPALV